MSLYYSTFYGETPILFTRSMERLRERTKELYNVTCKEYMEYLSDPKSKHTHYIFKGQIKNKKVRRKLNKKFNHTQYLKALHPESPKFVKHKHHFALKRSVTSQNIQILMEYETKRREAANKKVKQRFELQPQSPDQNKFRSSPLREFTINLKTVDFIKPAEALAPIVKEVITKGFTKRHRSVNIRRKKKRIRSRLLQTSMVKHVRNIPFLKTKNCGEKWLKLRNKLLHINSQKHLLTPDKKMKILEQSALLQRNQLSPLKKPLIHLRKSFDDIIEHKLKAVLPKNKLKRSKTITMIKRDKKLSLLLVKSKPIGALIRLKSMIMPVLPKIKEEEEEEVCHFSKDTLKPIDIPKKTNKSQDVKQPQYGPFQRSFYRKKPLRQRRKSKLMTLQIPGKYKKPQSPQKKSQFVDKRSFMETFHGVIQIQRKRSFLLDKMKQQKKIIDRHKDRFKKR